MNPRPSAAPQARADVAWQPAPGEVGLYDLLAPVLRRWHAVAAACFAFAAVTAAIVFTRPREYRASVSLSTVSNPRSPALASGVSALLSQSNVGGLQSTPALIVLLSRQRGVLARVAEAPVDSGRPQTLGDRLQAIRGGPVPTRDIPRVFAAEVAGAFDRQTGVISLDVVSRDSAFARAAVRELVAEISRTFSRASRAQGSELRRAMDARVDSAGRALRRSQEELRAFRAGNRQVAVFSSAGVEQDDLQRAVTLAQTVYAQAVTDRESAIARELEDTPAVVVLDALPPELPIEPRHGAAKLIGAVLAGAVLSSLLILLRDGLARARAQRADRSTHEADREVTHGMAPHPEMWPELGEVVRTAPRGAESAARSRGDRADVARDRTRVQP